MKFWIEQNIDIGYEQFIKDLNKDKFDSNLEGYSYYLKLIKTLVSNNNLLTIDGLVLHLQKNASKLNFNLNTSGTSSIPKIIKVNLKNCIRQVKKNKTLSKPKIWGICYPAHSFASKQVFFQSLFNKESVLNSLFIFSEIFSLRLCKFFSTISEANWSSIGTFFTLSCISLILI